MIDIKVLKILIVAALVVLIPLGLATCGVI